MNSFFDTEYLMLTRQRDLEKSARNYWMYSGIKAKKRFGEKRKVGSNMQTFIARLSEWIEEVQEKWHKTPHAELSFKPLPHKWSKKEILGHLCDSAVNNQQRFIRSQSVQDVYTVVKYDPDDWVKANGYQHATKDEIINLWVSLNKQMIHIVSNIPGDKLQTACDIGDSEQVTLEWLVNDYLDHMEHHLKQVFE